MYKRQGVDLTRRMSQKEVYALTYPLLTTSDGKKMGKTEKGAVWLDGEKTSPHEYFQYWRNVPDDRVEACLKYFTFLDVEEIESLVKVEGSALNEAKVRLGWEATALLHGEEAANDAKDAAKAAFAGGGDRDKIPTTELSADDVADSLPLFDLLRRSGLAASGGEARRLVKGGGVSVNGEKISDPERRYSKDDFSSTLELRKGKKNIHLFRLAD